MAKKFAGFMIRPGGYFRIDRFWFESEAYRALSPAARSLLFEFHNLNQNQNGRLGISVDRAARLLGCSPNTARAAFRQLEKHAFLVPTIEADPMGRRVRQYRLTTQPTKGREPGDEWKLWQPDPL